jgi:hypothetical protein
MEFEEEKFRTKVVSRKIPREKDSLENFRLGKKKAAN